MRKLSQNEAGFSMIEALVAIGLFSVAALAHAKFQINAAATDAHMQVEADVADVYAFVRERLSCETTFKALDSSACGDPNAFVEARDRAGKMLLAADGSTRVGDFALRVQCLEGGDELRVERRRMKHRSPGKGAAKKHLTRATESWEDLFRGIPVFRRSLASSFLNFEAAMGGAPDLPIKDQFWASHGVRFRAMNADGSYKDDLVLRQAAKFGETLPDAKEAWRCTKCPRIGTDFRNRLMDADAEARVGGLFLSTQSATTDATAAVEIEYKAPVNRLSFDLIDLDGSETWSFTLLDSDRNVLGTTTHYTAVKGYNKKKSFTGRPRNFVLEWNTPEIRYVIISGKKRSDYFGFAFDNFDTGVERCAPRPKRNG